MQSMENCYNFLEKANLKQYLTDHTTEGMYENFKKCILNNDLA